MKLYDASLIIILSILVISAVIGTVSIKYFGPDNAIEEISEDIILIETGKEIDLSPIKQPQVQNAVD